MNVDEITALLITFNERPNIARSLDALRWVRRVIVLDSGSNDGTAEIAAAHSNCELFTRKFDDFASQCNFGLGLVKTPWTLSLDADYILDSAFSREVQSLSPADDVVGYEASFIYCVYGHPLRGTLYPARTVLYRTHLGKYVNEGHGHRVAVGGAVCPIRSKIFHDDRKPLNRWFSTQVDYARREAEYLLAADFHAFRISDRIRRLAWPAPGLVFLYLVLVKRCAFDGWAGWFYILQRVLAEVLVALEVIDRRLQGANLAGPNCGHSSDKSAV